MKTSSEGITRNIGDKIWISLFDSESSKYAPKRIVLEDDYKYEFFVGYQTCLSSCQQLNEKMGL